MDHLFPRVSLKASLQFSLMVALRYLWSKRSEAFITIITVISVLGVAVGVMVLNMTMAIMTGFQTELKTRVVGANSHILVWGTSGRIDDWSQIAERIRGVAGVQSVSAFTQNQALLKSERGLGNTEAVGVLIRGVQENSAAAEQVRAYMGLSKGEKLPLFDPPAIEVTNPLGQEESVVLPALVVGRQLQRSLGVITGVPVSVLSPQTGASPFGLMPRFKRFVIAGIYQSGLSEFESGLAYASLTDAQRFFSMGDAVSGLEVRVDNVGDAPKITRQMMEALGGVQSGVYARDWTESNRALWEALQLERRVYFIVLLLIIVMASFSIVTTLIMLVIEKRRDIAILRTMGATPRSVGMVFFMQGAVIGAIGTVLGMLFGYFGCLALRWYGFPLNEEIFQMSTVPVYIEPVNFLVVGVSAFTICCVATIYPAFRASRLHPAELLRYE